MSENDTKFASTAIIWLAFTVVMIAALAAAHSFSSGILVMMMLMFTIAAAAGTQAIWKHYGTRSSEANEKSKRRTRLDHLLEGMDDGELEELRTRLLAASDGELISFEDRERSHS